MDNSVNTHTNAEIIFTFEASYSDYALYTVYNRTSDFYDTLASCTISRIRNCSTQMFCTAEFQESRSYDSSTLLSLSGCLMSTLTLVPCLFCVHSYVHSLQSLVQGLSRLFQGVSRDVQPCTVNKVTPPHAG